MTVNLGNKPGGSSADSFKGRFQFGKLLAAAPTGDIAERIVRRIKPVMLADGIGDTFRLYFTGAPVGAGLLLFGVYVVVQPCMGNFMDCRFQGLQFAHALAYGNALFLIIGIAFCIAPDWLKGNRKRGRFFKGGEKVPILFNVAGEFINTDCR